MDLEKMIIPKIDSSWSLLEKARFIYIELGKLVTFSTKFLNGSYSELLRAKVSINKLDSLEVNCVIWSQLYSQLLYKINIPNKIIKGNGHEWVEFYIDGKTYSGDATYGDYTDLSRIKNNDSTTLFGVSKIPGKSMYILDTKEWQRELDSMDEMLGYDLNKRENLISLKSRLKEIANGDIALDEIAHCEVDDPISFKLDYLFSIVGKLNDGYYEAGRFIYNLEECLFTKEELEKIGAVGLKKTNPDKTISIIKCIYTKHKEEPTYYLMAPNLPIQRFSADDILSLSQKGYGIESKAIPGIIYPKKFVPGKCSETLSYKLYKHFSKEKTDIDEYAEMTTKTR